jgi:hypothetical protein
MPRPASDRAAIKTEIVRVRSLGLDALRTLWRVTFREEWTTVFGSQRLTGALTSPSC